MKPNPRLFKAHAQVVADELVKLGWILRHEFRADRDEEPYEFILEWLGSDEPPAIDTSRFSSPISAKKKEPNSESSVSQQPTQDSG